MRILIAGATGNTGARLTRILAEDGHTPIAMIRKGSDTSVLPEGAQTRDGDLTDLQQGIADDVDAVVFAAGSGGDTSAEMTDKVDRDGAKALIDAALYANVPRFVMLSSIGTDDPESGPEKMQHYLKAKQEADRYLAASGLAYAIVRPVSLTDKDGTGQIELSTEHVEGDEISRDDVAAVLARCVTAPPVGNATFEIAAGQVPVEKALASL